MSLLNLADLPMPVSDTDLPIRQLPAWILEHARAQEKKAEAEVALLEARVADLKSKYEDEWGMVEGWYHQKRLKGAEEALQQAWTHLTTVAHALALTQHEAYLHDCWRTGIELGRMEDELRWMQAHDRHHMTIGPRSAGGNS